MTENNDYWSSNYVDAHRRGINGMDWLSMQSKGPPLYVVGDVVSFRAGGMGIITDVDPAKGGFPTLYSADRIPNVPFHPNGKVAWHCEGDIEALIEPSAVRKI